MDFELDNSSNSLICGIIGFKTDLYNNYCSQFGVINRLKANNITDNYNWIIKYNSSDEGLLIIGSEMNEIITNYDPSNLFQMNIKINGGNYRWSFDIDKIVCGENISLSENGIWFEINNDFSFLQGNIEYERYISEIFFNDFLNKNICRKNIWNNNYIIFECNKNGFGIEQIKYFPSISFIIKSLGTEIKFENIELFTETKYKYFFNIIFSQFDYSKWVFGKLFLKKYPTMFNIDKKIIQIYININDEEEKDECEEEEKDEYEEEEKGECEEEEKEKEENIDNEEDSDIEKKDDNKIIGLSKTNFILLISGIIIFIIISGFFCYLLIKRYKRQKNNELNYDYINKNENNDISLPSL